MREDSRRCAVSVMDTLALVMRAVGTEMQKRAQRTPDVLSISQFRAMKIIEDFHEPSLSLVAEHLGGTLSAASKTVDGLSERGLVARSIDPKDRRRIALSLTEAGRSMLNTVSTEAHTILAERVESLTAGEAAMVELAMGVLKSAIVGGKGADG